MLRKTLVVVALSILATTACKKKSETEGTTGASSGGGGGTAATTAAAAGGKKQWQTVDRVPFAKLQTILPATLGALKRSDLGGSMVPQDEYTHSEANAHYDGPKDAVLVLRIEDNPVDAEDQIPSKTSSFKGFPVVQESEGGGAADVRIVVGDRFIVSAHGNEMTAADVKAALEKLDLTKLASWKDEGVKK